MRTTLYVWAVCLFAAPLIAAAQAPGERNSATPEHLLRGDPISPAQIVFALESGVDPAHLQAMVAARGLTEPPSEDFLHDLELMEAPPSLVETVHAAVVHVVPPAEPAPPAAPEGYVPLPAVPFEEPDLKKGEGRLDLRIHVDGASEVRVRGDKLIHRTLAGEQGRNAGTQYTEPLPTRPLATLDVKQMDGRGVWTILQYPAAKNEYEMVLRIYDEKGGEDRYHLRFTWTVSAEE